MSLQFGFVVFGQKDFGAKAAHKMLLKLTPGWENDLILAPMDLKNFRTGSKNAMIKSHSQIASVNAPVCSHYVYTMISMRPMYTA